MTAILKLPCPVHRTLEGLKKALIGWTTLEEVERNTPPDVGYKPSRR